MTPVIRKGTIQPTTITEAVNAFVSVLSNNKLDLIAENLAKIRISKFVKKENINAFIHLICNSVLLNQARFSEKDYEAIIAAEIEELKDTDWFIPAALSLVELRYTKETLKNITFVEKEAILEFYEIGDLRGANHFSFHRSGTTSIIFHSGANAIKIVRPVYLLDQEVASLDRYIEKYAAAPLAPKLISAKSSVLVMEFVRGQTLEEIIQKNSDSMSHGEKLQLISRIGDMLKQIHTQEFPHGDLNPRNIIIESLSENDCSLKLIDYGYNYSLTKPVLSAQSYRESIRYIAPAGSDSTRNPYLDDLYSASVIIIDIWFRDISGTPDELLHQLSIEQPLISFVLEDCLVADAELRMKKLAGSNAESSQRSQHFAAALALACSERAQSRTPDNKTSLVAALMTNPLEFFKPEEQDGGVGYVLDSSTNKRLNFYRAVCISVTALIATAIFAILREELSGGGGIFGKIRYWWFTNGIAITPESASMWEIIPGLAICLSFSLLATKYYLSIFSSTAPWTSAGHGGRLASWTMRLNSFAYAIPIAYCFLLDPAAWPFCSAIGLAIVALNNIATFRMLRSVRKSSMFRALALSRSAEAKSAYVVFAGWGALVSLYALGITLAGIVLITSEPAKNNLLDGIVGSNVKYNIYEYLLAFCVIGINYFKMQRENCGRLAPKIRALVQRYIEAAKTYPVTGEA